MAREVARDLIEFKSSALADEWDLRPLTPPLVFLVVQIARLVRLLEEDERLLVTCLQAGRYTEPHRSGRAADFRTRNLRVSTVLALLWTVNEAFPRPVDSDGVQRWTLLLESSSAEDLAPFAGCPGVWYRPGLDVPTHLHAQTPWELPPGSWPSIL